MKFIILTAILSISTISFGQSFKNDWTTFTAKNWTFKYIDDKSEYLDKKTQGQLIFQNLSDSTLTVTYCVYLESEVDSAFNNKIQQWRFAQSCLSLTNGKLNFMSFGLKDFFYLLMPCHLCYTGTNKECELLAIELFNFFIKK